MRPGDDYEVIATNFSLALFLVVLSNKFFDFSILSFFIFNFFVANFLVKNWKSVHGNFLFWSVHCKNGTVDSTTLLTSDNFIEIGEKYYLNFFQ